jgi:molybdopterin synthase catalytic subunit
MIPAHPKLFEIVNRPISIDDVAARVGAPDRGGITLFAGTVRGVTGGVVTSHLEYEAYAEMAEPILAEIAAEAQARWPSVSAVSIVHRTGRLEVGDVSIVIAVAAAHRQDTFAACHYLIDRIKQIAPIWKREFGQDGAVWVEGPESTVGGSARTEPE